MSGFITISCPSCENKRQITPDINRFGCTVCGKPHSVMRSGDALIITPDFNGTLNRKPSTDKTHTELVMKRLKSEIEELQEVYVRTHKNRQGATNVLISGVFIFFGGFILVTSIFTSNIPFILISLMSIVAGGYLLYGVYLSQRDCDAQMLEILNEAKKKLRELDRYEELLVR